VELVGSQAPSRSVIEARALLAELAKNSFHEVRIRAIDAFGEESLPTQTRAHTFGPEYRVGEFELDCMNQEGIVFASGEKLAAARNANPNPRADLAITGSAGGSSSLQFSAPHGIRPSGGSSFGEIPEAATFGTLTTLHTDDRSPETQIFAVRTAEGAMASVHIASSAFPKVRFEYVLKLQR
jgi:hypothetical protein